jgi:hypothetical protein
MSVAAYDRLLESATRWGFDSARLRQHLRTAFAACIAVFAAWALGLEHPQWAGMTVWAASQHCAASCWRKLFPYHGHAGRHSCRRCWCWWPTAICSG